MIGQESARGVRLAGAIVLGLLTAAAAGGAWGVLPASVLGWVVGGSVFCMWTLRVVHGMTPAQAQSHATREDSTRLLSDLLLLGGSLASLAGVAMLILSGAQEGGSSAATISTISTMSAVWQGVLGVAAVVVAWGVVHTVYLLRYAALYYAGTPGGIDFNQTELPDYGDFAYLAFTLGMTYQLSDTALTSSQLRRTVLRHTLLSYLLGSVILATTINLVVQIAGR